ncbi:unnamed protein product [Polarella glacialis]|uniref:Uncharacterized protein n=1 Tax=Polarella glacialis TaxID=89957 RepID=A0A813GQT3_POLGL|nr:unnamed protein product [Polarella glacialis]
MGKGKPRHRDRPEAMDSATGGPELDDSDIEEADIEGFARSRLMAGETILGDRPEGEDEEEEGKGAGKGEAQNLAKRGVCIAPLLLQRLVDIEYKVPEGAKRVPWVDTLTIDGISALPKGVGAKDGVKLESTFLGMAHEAVKEAYRRLRVMKIPCSRPSDFYAEMMRPDKQMYRVRQQAAEEERRIKIVETRKKSMAAKKFSKKAKTHKIEARAGEKRKTLDDIADWRAKSKQSQGNADDQDLEDILNKQNTKRKSPGEDSKGDGKGKGKDGKDAKGKGKGKDEDGKGKGKNPKKSQHRENADSKYGFGGKKKRAKQNDKDSSSMGATFVDSLDQLVQSIYGASLLDPLMMSDQMALQVVLLLNLIHITSALDVFSLDTGDLKSEAKAKEGRERRGDDRFAGPRVDELRSRCSGEMRCLCNSVPLSPRLIAGLRIAQSVTFERVCGADLHFVALLRDPQSLNSDRRKISQSAPPQLTLAAALPLSSVIRLSSERPCRGAQLWGWGGSGRPPSFPGRGDEDGACRIGSLSEMASLFDEAISSLAEELMSIAPEGPASSELARASLELNVRQKCCRMLDEQLTLFRETAAEREQVAKVRQARKLRAACKLKDLQLQANQLRAVSSAVTLVSKAAAVGSATLLFSLWAQVVSDKRAGKEADAQKQEQRSLVSPQDIAKMIAKVPTAAKSRKAGQENDPPQTAGNQSLQAQALAKFRVAPPSSLETQGTGAAAAAPDRQQSSQGESRVLAVPEVTPPHPQQLQSTPAVVGTTEASRPCPVRSFSPPVGDRGRLRGPPVPPGRTSEEGVLRVGGCSARTPPAAHAPLRVFTAATQSTSRDVNCRSPSPPGFRPTERSQASSMPTASSTLHAQQPAQRCASPLRSPPVPVASAPSASIPSPMLTSRGGVVPVRTVGSSNSYSGPPGVPTPRNQGTSHARVMSASTPIASASVRHVGSPVPAPSPAMGGHVAAGFRQGSPQAHPGLLVQPQQTFQMPHTGGYNMHVPWAQQATPTRAPPAAHNSLYANIIRPGGYFA